MLNGFVMSIKFFNTCKCPYTVLNLLKDLVLSRQCLYKLKVIFADTMHINVERS